MSEDKTIRLKLRYAGKGEPVVTPSEVILPYEEYEDLQALAATRLELAKVVDRHRKDRMHSDMKLGWEMAQKILKEAKKLCGGQNE